jgi:xylulokinase
MNKMKFLLGYDIGSSSVKASVLNAETGKLIGSAASPKQEMKIQSPHPGWAEQDPQLWWTHIVKATYQLVDQFQIKGSQVEAIGISYQMHGLVAVDSNQNVLRPSIIWCDSRAVEIGRKAFRDLGEEFSLTHYLNSPGNFTASKLKWVKENEPALYDRIDKIMLPGDYAAMKMTGRICTTVSGLSEGIMWDYQQKNLASDLLQYYGISEEMIPEALASFSNQGTLSAGAANELRLSEGIPITYRAGDQPNNAFSLNVLNPGEAATTAGTSGVIYGVTDQPSYDKQSRVNTFVHVNHTDELDRYGVLLCINGTGILNSWLKHNLGITGSIEYDQLNKLAAKSPIGSGGISILPFGNGAERILENREPGASVHGLNFNRHSNADLLRAAQEGIVFSLYYGLQIMQDMGIKTDKVKAGHANMFLSPIFREAFVNTTGTTLELYNTDGSQGAARGAGVGSGYYASPAEAFSGLERMDVIEPEADKRRKYLDAYSNWLEKLNLTIKNRQ